MTMQLRPDPFGDSFVPLTEVHRTADSGPVRELEMRRLRSGHYLIEGYDVVRYGSRKWVIDFCGARVSARCRTLRDAKDLIRDQIERKS